MDFVVHDVNANQIAEIISDDLVINDLQDALDLIANLSYQEINKIIINENNITSEFFNLRSRLAGEILQKCVNYGIKIAIVGDFEKYQSESLKAFITESNRGNQFFFVTDITKAMQMLIKA